MSLGLVKYAVSGMCAQHDLKDGTDAGLIGEQPCWLLLLLPCLPALHSFNCFLLFLFCYAGHIVLILETRLTGEQPCQLLHYTGIWSPARTAQAKMFCCFMPLLAVALSCLHLPSPDG